MVVRHTEDSGPSQPMGTLGTCPGPPDFFLFEGPPTGCGEIFLTNYLIVAINETV